METIPRQQLRPAGLALGFAVLTALAAPVQAQHARTAVLDADAGASVALIRAMARGWAQQGQREALSGTAARPGAAYSSNWTGSHLQMPEGAVVRPYPLRQLVVVPDSIQSCQAELNVGTVQTDRPILGNVNLQVVVTGNITQLVGGTCR